MKLTKTKLKQIIDEVKQEQTLKESKFAATAEEEAERVVAQTGISLVTDPEHWARVGVHTGEDLAKSLLASSYSDLYKSIHGIRPRHINFKNMSVEELQAILDELDNYEQELGDEGDWDEESEIEKQRRLDDEAMQAGDWSDPQDNFPPDYDYEDFPKRSGMKRRVSRGGPNLREEKARLKQIIVEELKNILK